MTLSFEIYFLFLSDPVDRIEFNHKKIANHLLRLFRHEVLPLHQLKLIIKIHI